MTKFGDHLRTDAGPSLDRIKRYAKARGLDVRITNATQYEPEFVVSLARNGHEWQPTILSRTSRDSVESAAFYLVNTLETLGAEVPGVVEVPVDGS